MYSLFKYNFPDVLNIAENKFLAHTKGDEQESLNEHLFKVYTYAVELIDHKKLITSFDYFYERMLADDNVSVKYFYYQMIIDTIIFHDIGKVNPNFQFKKMKNKAFKNMNNYESNDSNHSIYSSVIFINYYIEKIKENSELFNDDIIAKLLHFTLLNAYVISKHHGSLDDLNFLNEIKTAHENMCGHMQFSELIKQKMKSEEYKRLSKLGFDIYNLNREENYYYTKIMFSLLVSADFYATTDYINDYKPNVYKDNNIFAKYLKELNGNKVVHQIRKHEKYLNSNNMQSVFKDNDINKLRNELFLETEQVVLANLDASLFFLEAPTGSGKTLMSLNHALKIANEKNMQKIIYVFPFNNLVEQTFNSLKNIFSSDLISDIRVLNSITGILNCELDKENFFVDKKANFFVKAVQDKQFIHEDFIITTNIKLFDFLFGLDRDNHFPLIQLANSVIIIDEIQVYKNDIWYEIIYLLYKYAKILNLKIIIMSATLPDLSLLHDEELSIVKLNQNVDKYYQHQLFKNRVILDDSLLNKTSNLNFEDIMPILLDSIKDYIKNNKKILMEFLIKKNAQLFFEYLCKQNLNYNIEYMSGNDNLKERKRIIDLTKNNQGLILVATQVVEAGIDIDMDIGYKEMSFLEAEEQFLGRINRSSSKKECKTFFFSYLNNGIDKVYRKDLRSSDKYIINNKEIFEILYNKAFSKYYTLLLENQKENKEEHNDKGKIAFHRSLANGEFKKIKEIMELIEGSKKQRLVLAKEIESEHVYNLWKKLEELYNCSELDYSEKIIRIDEISKKLYEYTYEISYYENMNCSFSYNGVIGELILILNADQYFVNNKFNASLLNANLEMI